MARKRLQPEAYVEGILSGDKVVLSKAITLIESTLASDADLAREVIKGCLPHSGNSYRIGITGIPGVGKSTFMDAFGTMLTALDHKLAVLAIDPSSSLTKGSILGDKTRMSRLSQDSNAYIRPSPTGGSLGGVARKTRETMILCEAAGYNLVFVETVGVGQSEISVREMTDAFLLLLLPHAGDELQGIKKGIMEMADLLVIHKADGEYLPAARKAKASFSQALRLFPHNDGGWVPPVSLCSSIEETGLDAIWTLLEEYRQLMKKGKFWEMRRQEQAVFWMKETISRQLESTFYDHALVKGNMQGMMDEVRLGKRSPVDAAQELIDLWAGNQEP